jgi:hypothetical protein
MCRLVPKDSQKAQVLVNGAMLGQREPICDVPGIGHEIWVDVHVIGVISLLNVVKEDVVLCVILYRWGHFCCGSMILGFMWCVCGAMLAREK